ncbi:DUF2232 domain-containing protein [Pannus brasiliensis CCIBt3594]|uniref:DUF2232 domain-containing protein n=1 Tax=Pannus brasiliensis CCIBt3594 TaxID=1427578 RepID=A0AAW9QPK7_9CHRO
MDHFSADTASSGDLDRDRQDEINWVDLGDETAPAPVPSSPPSPPAPSVKSLSTLVMVETAFLASATSLLWLINYYFPLGPLLRLFFPLPIALAYLRWGHRSAWMTAIVSSLLLSVLMGPTRSVVFLVPYGLMGVQLGLCWRRGARWEFSIFTGALLGAIGLFFRFWLFSILLGENLWMYVISQATNFIDWAFTRLGWLVKPTLVQVQTVAFIGIFLNSLLYLFAVHLVALLVLDRLGDRIPRPPEWVRVLLDYE